MKAHQHPVLVAVQKYCKDNIVIYICLTTLSLFRFRGQEELGNVIYCLKNCFDIFFFLISTNKFGNEKCFLGINTFHYEILNWQTKKYSVSQLVGCYDYQYK